MQSERQNDCSFSCRRKILFVGNLLLLQRLQYSEMHLLLNMINAFSSFLHLEQEKSKNKGVNKLAAARVLEQNAKSNVRFFL